VIEPEQPGCVESEDAHAIQAVRAVSEALLAGLGARRIRLSLTVADGGGLEIGGEVGTGAAGTDIWRRSWGPDGSLATLEVEPAAAASGPLPRQAAERRDSAAEPLRRLLEVGIRARSPLEAAEAVASVAAEMLGFPVGCAYLVDPLGRISDVAAVGAGRDGTRRLRECLVGRAASPVWRRMVESPNAGPDLVADTRAPGAVRRGGLAETMGFGSMAGILLHSSDGPLGLVVCGGPDPRSPHPLAGQ
jgi:hypothetical protein